MSPVTHGPLEGAMLTPNVRLREVIAACAEEEKEKAAAEEEEGGDRKKHTGSSGKDDALDASGVRSVCWACCVVGDQ